MRATASFLNGSAIATLLFSLSASSQTLYVPSGTSGIGASSNGNVGIGFSAPAYKLDVNSPSSRVATNSYGGITFDNLPYPNQGALLFSSDRTGYTFSIGNRRQSDGNVLPIITMFDYGNVGIGTTNPTELLSLAANQGINTKLSSYAHFGTDYSSWSTIVGNNVRAKRGQIAGMELATSYVGNGGSAIRLMWDTLEFHAASASDIASYSEGTAYSFPRAVLKASGNLGIGLTSPSHRLDVFGPSAAFPARVGSPDGYLQFGPANTSWCHFMTDRPRFYFNTGVTTGDGSFGSYSGDLSLQTAGTTRVTVANSTGNVGIGTTNPGTNKLSVNGTIRAKEVIVEASPWPDDVFAADYDLPTVDEIAAHIEAEGHLPGVPSAAVVAEHGVAIGEMQKALLRKVEELTLYAIRQQKEIEELRTEVASLRKSQP